MKYELLGIENMNGKDFYVLKTNDGLKEAFTYFDVTTFMKVKSVEIKKEGDQIVESTTTFADFKDVHGILFPQTFTLAAEDNVFTGKIISTIINGKPDFKPYM